MANGTRRGSGVGSLSPPCPSPSCATPARLQTASSFLLKIAPLELKFVLVLWKKTKNRQQDTALGGNATASPWHQASRQQTGRPGSPHPWPFFLFHFSPLLKQQRDSKQQRCRAGGRSQQSPSEPPEPPSPPLPRHCIAQTALGMDTKIKQLCDFDIYNFIYIFVYIFLSIYRWMEKQRS